MEVNPEVQTTFENTEIGYLCSAVMRTDEGKALIEKLKELYVYRSPFAISLAERAQIGSTAEYLFFRQGHADLIRWIEKCAKAYQEPKRKEEDK